MLPSLEELQDRAHVVRLPLVTRFRGVDEREVLLLDGPHGWGEFAPFVEYAAAEASRWLAAAVEAGWSRLAERRAATASRSTRSSPRSARPRRRGWCATAAAAVRRR